MKIGMIPVNIGVSTAEEVVGLARLAPGEPDDVPNYPAIMAGALMVSIIPLTMIAVLQRQIVRGLTLTEK